MICYTYDEWGNYTREHVHVKYQPLPVRYTETAPPEGDYPVWRGGQWELWDEPDAPPEPTAEDLLERARARASLPKDDFILAALDAGVLTESDAEEATSGWPTGWAAFFTGHPTRDRIEAKARWANATTIARNAPLIEALAAFKGLTPGQVDALFGIAP